MASLFLHAPDHHHQHHQQRTTTTTAAAATTSSSPSTASSTTDVRFVYEHVVSMRVSDDDVSPDKWLPLTVKVGVVHPSVATKQAAISMLLLQITSDDDPFFLHSLRLDEHTFHALKRDQQLLVDFQAFSTKFIELLERCTGNDDDGTAALGSGSTTATKFSALLQVNTRRGESVFSVVESNQFKRLQHLAMTMTLGDDHAIKQYLASRLSMLNTQHECARRELDETRERLNTTVHEYREMEVRMNEVRGDATQQVSALKVQHANELSAVKAEAARGNQQLAAACEHRVRDADTQHREQVVELQRRCDDLQARATELGETKVALEHERHKLQTNWTSAQGELAECQRELDLLRGQNKVLDTGRCEHERSISQQSVTLVSLQQQVRDKDELVATLNEHVAAAREQKHNLEQSVALYRANYEKSESHLQTCVAEVKKANAIIQHLNEEKKKLRAKLRHQKTQIAHLVDGQRQQNDAIAATERKLEVIGRDVARMEDENQTLRDNLRRSQQALTEGQNQLKSNNKVIEWLNKELNQAKMGTLTPHSFAMSGGVDMHKRSLAPTAAATTVDMTASTASSLLSSSRFRMTNNNSSSDNNSSNNNTASSSFVSPTSLPPVSTRMVRTQYEAHDHTRAYLPPPMSMSSSAIPKPAVGSSYFNNANDDDNNNDLVSAAAPPLSHHHQRQRQQHVPAVM